MTWVQHHRAECYCFRRHVLTVRDFVGPCIIIFTSELLSCDWRREMPWEYCWWSSKSSLLSIKRLGAWRWQIRNNDARWAFVRFEAHIYREFIRVQWRAGLLGRPVKLLIHKTQLFGRVQSTFIAYPCQSLRWSGSIPAKIRNIDQKIPVSVVLAIPQLRTPQITKIQQLSFMKPRCNSGFVSVSLLVGGEAERPPNGPGVLNRVSTSESVARSRFASWEAKAEEVLEGGLVEAQPHAAAKECDLAFAFFFALFAHPSLSVVSRLATPYRISSWKTCGMEFYVMA